MVSCDFSQPGTYPRSPRETLGHYVIAARTLDKCRAALAGTLGDYKFDCPLDNFFFDFAGLSAESFREFVASGADDEAVAAWIGAQGAGLPASDRFGAVGGGAGTALRPRRRPAAGRRRQRRGARLYRCGA